MRNIIHQEIAETDCAGEPLQEDTCLGDGSEVTAEQALQDLEGIIERAQRLALDEAKALRTIRDDRLYRDRYANFAEYCEQRWEMSRAHANRLCDWAEVTENLSPFGDRLPKRETHARPLSALTKEQQLQAWGEFIECCAGRQTAEQIQAVCDRIHPHAAASAKVISPEAFEQPKIPHSKQRKPRSTVLEIRLSRAERQMVETAANTEGVTASQWVRQAIVTLLTELREQNGSSEKECD